MKIEHLLFTAAVEVVGMWLLIQNIKAWKKGVTHIYYYPFFGSRRLDPVYRHEEPIIFHIILLWETLLIIGVMATMLYCIIGVYLYDHGLAELMLSL
ncbi:hypothetical protein [Enterobacter oligotrophicus]|uniref:hypothetical protein n=1 Tax=Enterobacter oligotrophicus TaxID=2478464 RepID=UPI0012611FC5|nr:hypothetical protein [Enterobacter oligotrophicus]